MQLFGTSASVRERASWSLTLPPTVCRSVGHDWSCWKLLHTSLPPRLHKSLLHELPVRSQPQQQLLHWRISAGLWIHGGGGQDQTENVKTFLLKKTTPNNKSPYEHMGMSPPAQMKERSFISTHKKASKHLKKMAEDLVETLQRWKTTIWLQKRQSEDLVFK